MKQILKMLKINQEGSGLLTILVFISILLILLGVLLSKLENEFALGTVTYHNTQALNLAEAGVEKAIYELSRTNGNYTGEKNTGLGSGKFTVTVKLGQGGYKIISIGETRSAKKYTGRKTITALIQRSGASHWKIISWQEN